VFKADMFLISFWEPFCILSVDFKYYSISDFQFEIYRLCRGAHFVTSASGSYSGASAREARQRSTMGKKNW